MTNVRFTAEHGPYKAGSYSQFTDDKARELESQKLVEILDPPASDTLKDQVEPEHPIDIEPSRVRKSK